MSHARRILILFAHPALHKSRANRYLSTAVQGVPGVTFHDLYEVYPHLQIDVAREQQLLREHDVVVFQHPFYWYSSPAILKEWQDLVLEWGFAYGENGNALNGKQFLTAITTGGTEEAYHPEGSNRFTIRQLLLPFETTARLCGMEYLPPWVMHATHRLTKNELFDQAREYRRLIEALRDDRVNWPELRTAEILRPPIEASYLLPSHG